MSRKWEKRAFMEYNKIIAVTGLPGLYELLSSKADGAIVRSLDDKATRFVASRSHNFSHLETIEVYTVRDNVNLVDILKAMEASGEKLPDEKDNAALKAYFGKVYPDLDFDRVYSSDLKKMVKWFGVLKSNNIEIKLSEPEEEVEAVEEVKEEKKPQKKAEAGIKEKPAKEAPVAEKPAAKKAAPTKAAAEEKTAAKKPAAEAKTAAPKKKETPAAAAPKKKEKTEDAPKSKSKETAAADAKVDRPKKTAKKK
jgi:Domain of unknown function (DUF5606)